MNLVNVSAWFGPKIELGGKGGDDVMGTKYFDTMDYLKMLIYLKWRPV